MLANSLTTQGVVPLWPLASCSFLLPQGRTWSAFHISLQCCSCSLLQFTVNHPSTPDLPHCRLSSLEPSPKSQVSSRSGSAGMGLRLENQPQKRLFPAGP